MPNKKVIFLLDNPLRDLPGLVLIASQCAENNIDVYLVPMNLAYYNRLEEVLRICPDAILMNYLRVSNSGFVKSINQLGIPIFVLDTEGGMLTDCSIYTRNLDKLRDLYRIIVRYFSWGRTLADFLVEKQAYRPQQVQITGSPRHDFYVKPWKAVALKGNDFPTAPDRAQIILLNSNFPTINPAFQDARSEKDNLVRLHGLTEEEAEGICRTQEQALKDFVEIANTLAREFPKATVVFRPHPFESEEPYKRLLDRRENLVLIKKGTVDGWILKSACVVQRGCSTAIEAGIAGVPTLSPLWVPMHLPQPAAESVSVPCSSLSSLVDSVRSVLAGTFEVPNAAKENIGLVVENWFHCRDGQAHHRVAGGLVEAVQLGGLSKETAGKVKSLYRSFMSFSLRERVKGLIGALAGWEPDWAWVNLRQKSKAATTRVRPSLRERFRAFAGFILGFPRNHAWFTPHYGQWPSVFGWKSGPKAFSVEDVRRNLEWIALEAGGRWNSVEASQCEPGRDYRFGDHAGVSVKIHKKNS